MCLLARFAEDVAGLRYAGEILYGGEDAYPVPELRDDRTELVTDVQLHDRLDVQDIGIVTLRRDRGVTEMDESIGYVLVMCEKVTGAVTGVA